MRVGRKMVLDDVAKVPHTVSQKPEVAPTLVLLGAPIREHMHAGDPVGFPQRRQLHRFRARPSSGRQSELARGGGSQSRVRGSRKQKSMSRSGEPFRRRPTAPDLSVR